jgi:transcriptional regulator with XRE-family HTH domain
MGATPGEETIGERIRRLRLAQGLSQRELSGPGVSYAYVSRIEANQRKPSLTVIRLLARRLDVDPGYIETGDPVDEAAKRELRLADAELELRLGQDEARAEAELDALMREKANDITGVQARAALGLLASRRTDHLRTIRLLKGATASRYITPEARGDVYEALAAAYAANGTPNRAIRLLRQCIEAVADKEEAVSQLVRYKSLLATNLASTGALDEARAVVRDAADIASRVSSPSTRGMLLWAAGKASWMAGDPLAAKRQMSQALAIFEATEDTLALARAHRANAQMLALNAETDEAAAQLEQAKRLTELVGDRHDLGVLRADQAKLAARASDGETAVKRAREAEELLADDVRHRAEAQHALGAAYAAAGDIDAADAAFKSAVNLMEERSQRREAAQIARELRREAAQIAREWARALREVGREAEAFAVMERATMLAVRNMGAEARTRSLARDIPDSSV